VLNMSPSAEDGPPSPPRPVPNMSPSAGEGPPSPPQPVPNIPLGAGDQQHIHSDN
jgi:hypothetical protein